MSLIQNNRDSESAAAARLRAPGSTRIGRSFMAACYLAMAAGIGIIFLSGPADEPVTMALALVAPFAACLVMHFFMHRFLGRSCHSTQDKEPKR